MKMVRTRKTRGYSSGVREQDKEKGSTEIR